MNRAALLVALALAAPAAAEDCKTDPDAGNNVFTAVFDAKLGERITAQSSAVACDLTYDEKTGTASGAWVGKLVPEQPATFAAQVPFTVCGRGPADGRKEQVKGNALLFPPGAYGEKKTIRIRATIEGFDRDAYRIGPKYTEGWLARVQSLAKVVAASEPMGTRGCAVHHEGIDHRRRHSWWVGSLDVMVLPPAESI